MSEEYLKQLRELERQESHLKSQYTDDEKLDSADFYHTVVKSQLDESPEKGMTWSQYADKVKVYSKIHSTKNYNTHIDGPRKAWYTHRSPSGCFMCENINFINLMARVIGLMALQHPDNRF